MSLNYLKNMNKGREKFHFQIGTAVDIKQALDIVVKIQYLLVVGFLWML